MKVCLELAVFQIKLIWKNRKVKDELAKESCCIQF